MWNLWVWAEKMAEILRQSSSISSSSSSFGVLYHSSLRALGNEVYSIVWPLVSRWEWMNYSYRHWVFRIGLSQDANKGKPAHAAEWKRTKCFFLDASSHLYKWVRPSVRPSVRRSVTPSLSTLTRLRDASNAEYSALFFYQWKSDFVKVWHALLSFTRFITLLENNVLPLIQEKCSDKYSPRNHHSNNSFSFEGWFFSEKNCGLKTHFW